MSAHCGGETQLAPALVEGIRVVLFRKKDVDGRDISAFTRVFNALCPAMTPWWGNAERRTHSGLIFAALMIGHHFPASALCQAPSASGVS